MRKLPSLDHWHWLKAKIRCALAADEPRLIRRFMVESEAMVHCGLLPSWRAGETTFRLLMDTANDRALPWHWRCLCLDHAYRPLNDLERIADAPERRMRLGLLSRQLAMTELAPSYTYLERNIS
ncbi:FagA protein [Pseudomonas sp. RIT-PI-AD]|uniref:FagA protein n=1 Tax=Pseudomonas sp. RIT-PI-AD TaxID=3035294 RepID=UPI0021DB48F8|nr:FagA protein [Pseudomonas sp. RIT-PI-AD]